jgi:hypothetical protein
MDRTTIMLPEALKRRVEEKATQMHISLGEFLRRAAEDFLDKENRRWVDDPLVTGSYVIDSPAPSFVSENVDHYLYGKSKK